MSRHLSDVKPNSLRENNIRLVKHRETKTVSPQRKRMIITVTTIQLLEHIYRVF
jgi:hypothetical protein